MKEYQLKTFADVLLAVNDENAERFCTDFGEWLGFQLYLRKLSDEMKEKGIGEIAEKEIVAMTWVDDGKTGISKLMIEVTSEEPPPTSRDIA